MKIAGLDYSITSPGLCVGEKYHYWHKDPISVTPFYGHFYPQHKSQVERVSKIADDIIKYIGSVDLVVIEDYSFAASGRITQIAEGLGIIKYQLYINKIEFKTIAPPTLKKFATGSGRADKKQMVQQFIDDTGIDIYKAFNGNPKTKTIKAPITDMADAYYLMKMGEN